MFLFNFEKGSTAADLDVDPASVRTRSAEEVRSTVTTSEEPGFEVDNVSQVSTKIILDTEASVEELQDKAQDIDAVEAMTPTRQIASPSGDPADVTTPTIADNVEALNDDTSIVPDVKVTSDSSDAIDSVDEAHPS